MRAKVNPGWVAYKQAATPMLVPAYQYPTTGTMWAACNTYSAALVTGTGGAVKYVIADASNGPGASADANYTAAISAAFSAGLTVLGYVPTNYALGTPTLATAQAQVTGAASWPAIYPGTPPVTSIFVDQVSTLTGVETSYYQPLAATIHSVAGAIAVLNFGTWTFDPGYMAFTDIAVVYENDYQNGSWQTFLSSVPSFFASYPASRFAAIVYNCPFTWMPQVLAQAQTAGVGVMYVTDQTNYAGNPYGAQPAYLPYESAILAAR